MSGSHNPKTHASKTRSLVVKHTAPPNDQGGWMAVTREFLESCAYRSLSGNARKALDRLKIEHIGHGRSKNGELTVPHEQLYAYGVTSEYVADALEELAFKGLIKMVKGRAGNGTAHPTVFTLTFDGTCDGLPATNDWKRVTDEQIKHWSKVIRKQKMEERSKVGRKKKSPLRDSVIPPLRDSVIRPEK